MLGTTDTGRVVVVVVVGWGWGHLVAFQVLTFLLNTRNKFFGKPNALVCGCLLALLILLIVMATANTHGKQRD